MRTHSLRYADLVDLLGSEGELADALESLEERGIVEWYRRRGDEVDIRLAPGRELALCMADDHPAVFARNPLGHDLDRGFDFTSSPSTHSGRRSERVADMAAVIDYGAAAATLLHSGSLSDRPLRIWQLHCEGISIARIAERVGCSHRCAQYTIVACRKMAGLPPVQRSSRRASRANHGLPLFAVRGGVGGASAHDRGHVGAAA